jgi:hypothetical protein
MAMNVGGCMPLGGEEVWSRGERRWAIGIECWATTAALQIIIARTISTQAIPLLLLLASSEPERRWLKSQKKVLRLQEIQGGLFVYGNNASLAFKLLNCASCAHCTKVTNSPDECIMI